MPANLKNKKVLVMGLGRFGGGVTVTKFLAQQGAIVTVNDADPAEKLTDSIKQLAGLPNVTFKLGGHHLEDFLAHDLLIINPAVDKQKQPVVQQAIAKGIPYTTELNLLLERLPPSTTTIGITGSVGKSTTTTLIHEALKAALETRNSKLETPSVHLGGNIGKSLLLDLPNIRPTDIIVLELSSFMLEDTPTIKWSPNIALVTNLYANHLDRHNTLEQYAAEKQNILKFQTAKDTAILNADHPLVAAWKPLVEHATLRTYTTNIPQKLPLLIPGDHNQSNAQAALAILDALEERNIPLNRPAALAAIQNFPGLSHRLQLVYALTLPNQKTLRFYNDSKATSPDASITALHAFDPKTAIFLVGGYDKHIDLAPFEKLLANRTGAVIGLGQTGEAITKNVAAQNPTLPTTRIAYAQTLEAALPLAKQWATESPNLTAIVLSPASASWDQFPNYEKRGESFITLAKALGE